MVISEHNPDILCNCHQCHYKVPANLVSAIVNACFSLHSSVPNVIGINVLVRDTSDAVAVNLYGAHNRDTSAPDNFYQHSGLF